MFCFSPSEMSELQNVVCLCVCVFLGLSGLFKERGFQPPGCRTSLLKNRLQTLWIRGCPGEPQGCLLSPVLSHRSPTCVHTHGAPEAIGSSEEESLGEFKKKKFKHGFMN